MTTEYINLTQSKVLTLTCPNDKPEISYKDKKVLGLELRVKNNGTKNYRIYVTKNGKRYNKKIGNMQMSIDQIRQIASDYLVEIDLEQLYPNRKKSTVPTFRELYEDWLEQHAKIHKRTYKEDQSIFKCHLNDWKYCDFPADQITKVDVNNLIRYVAVEKKLERTSAKIKELMSTIYNRAIDLEILEKNPTTRIKTHATEERDRFLTISEIAKLTNAIRKEVNPIYRYFFACGVCIIARYSNIKDMRWDALDLDDGYYRIDSSISKNKRSYYMPLTKRAINVLKQVHIYSKNSEFVFPSYKLQNKPIQAPDKAFKKILDSIGLKDVRFHDLRRTQATFMVKTQANDFLIAKALQHSISSTVITARYARADGDDVRLACEKAQDLMFDNEFFLDL